MIFDLNNVFISPYTTFNLSLIEKRIPLRTAKAKINIKFKNIELKVKMNFSAQELKHVQ